VWNRSKRPEFEQFLPISPVPRAGCIGQRRTRPRIGFWICDRRSYPLARFRNAVAGFRRLWSDLRARLPDPLGRSSAHVCVSSEVAQIFCVFCNTRLDIPHKLMPESARSDQSTRATLGAMLALSRPCSGQRAGRERGTQLNPIRYHSSALCSTTMLAVGYPDCSEMHDHEANVDLQLQPPLQECLVTSPGMFADQECPPISPVVKLKLCAGFLSSTGSPPPPIFDKCL
jgi:hypothetical protein